MLTPGFDHLAQSAKVLRPAALGLVGRNVIIMMTPGAWLTLAGFWYAWPLALRLKTGGKLR